MTKTAVMSIILYKYVKIFFPGTDGPITMKLGMKHQSFKLIIFCSNDNPDLDIFYSKVKFCNLGF